MAYTLKILVFHKYWLRVAWKAIWQPILILNNVENDIEASWILTIIGEKQYIEAGILFCAASHRCRQLSVGKLINNMGFI